MSTRQYRHPPRLWIILPTVHSLGEYGSMEVEEKGHWGRWERLREAGAAFVPFFTVSYLNYAAASAQPFPLAATSPAHASVCNQTWVIWAFLCLKLPPTLIPYKIESKPLSVPYRLSVIPLTHWQLISAPQPTLLSVWVMHICILSSLAELLKLICKL